MAFKKAVKYKAKARVALIGPAGSGKTYTLLTLAKLLSGGSGKVAGLDTEHGSASKYADLFDFMVSEPSSYSPQVFLDALTEAEQAGMDVFFCDSLSHFWMGKDGALEFVDERAKRQKDKMGGWKDFRPHERAMVDRMIASPCHIIVTMRTKTAYEEQVDPDTGRKKRVKIGLAPVQRDGLEYEFDLVGYMDDDNNFVTDKTRCPAYAGRVIGKPDAKAFAPFVSWLDGAAQPAVITAEQWNTIVAEAKQHGCSLGLILDKYDVPGRKGSAVRADQYQSILKDILAHAADIMKPVRETVPPSREPGEEG